MPLVIDASVAVKFVVREHDTNLARKLLEVPDPLIAPDWLMVEAASTFYKKVKRSELLEVHAERHLEDMPLFFARFYSAGELAGEALRLSFRLKHSVYDCIYLALAQREGCRLVTADDKFAAVAGAAGLEHMVVRLT